MNSEEPFFRGKPVKLKKQFGSKLLGYLWDMRINDQGEPIFHVKLEAIDLFATLDMLDIAGDQDNISHLQNMVQ
jgi:hypothetical protein